MGMAAGLSAIFRSPIGTAIFAVEVLYGGMDFEAGALIYCMLAAIVACGLSLSLAPGAGNKAAIMRLPGTGCAVALDAVKAMSRPTPAWREPSEKWDRHLR